MFEELLLPFQFAFMQRAFLIAAIVSLPTALLSAFLVLKGWALMGDAISHSVLPGIVLAYIAGWPLLLGAFGAGMLCAVATGFIADNARVKEDTVMGVVFSGMFGLGIVLYVSVETNVHLDHILFGNMLGVAPDELWRAGIISVVIAGGIGLFWRDLLLHAFDPAQARAAGLAVGWLHYGLLAAIALTVVAVLSAAGLILAVGLLIAPGATAFLVARSFGAMMVLSVLVSAVAMLSGTYLSFLIDAAPAPTIILVFTMLFLLAFGRRMVVNRRASLSS
ncbi:MAG: metal ABC transporter permease [Pseudomonadota bacterium]